MIYLKVDEAYAFDYLAILEVKKNNNESKTDAWNDCMCDLSEQFSSEDWETLISSSEYKNMVFVNQETFNAVEKARYSKISAKKVDDCNMRRYNAKKQFQEKFFGSLLESKT
jgi:hypothetical protein